MHSWCTHVCPHTLTMYTPPALTPPEDPPPREVETTGGQRPSCTRRRLWQPVALPPVLTPWSRPGRAFLLPRGSLTPLPPSHPNSQGTLPTSTSFWASHLLRSFCRSGDIVTGSGGWDVVMSGPFLHLPLNVTFRSVAASPKTQCLKQLTLTPPSVAGPGVRASRSWAAVQRASRQPGLPLEGEPGPGGPLLCPFPWLRAHGPPRGRLSPLTVWQRCPPRKWLVQGVCREPAPGWGVRQSTWGTDAAGSGKAGEDVLPCALGGSGQGTCQLLSKGLPAPGWTPRGFGGWGVHS